MDAALVSNHLAPGSVQPLAGFVADLARRGLPEVARPRPRDGDIVPQHPAVYQGPTPHDRALPRSHVPGHRLGGDGFCSLPHGRVVGDHKMDGTAWSRRRVRHTLPPNPLLVRDW